MAEIIDEARPGAEKTPAQQRADLILTIVHAYKDEISLDNYLQPFLRDKPLRQTPANVLDDSFDLLLSHLGRYHTPNKPDRDRLFQMIEDGVQAVEQPDLDGPDTQSDKLKDVAGAYQTLMVINQPLVIRRAKVFNKKTAALGMAELTNEGSVGLSRAILLFDLAKGNEFSTYATHWIDMHIDRYIKIKNRSVRLPVNVEQDCRTVYWQKMEFTREFGREPTPEELSTYIDRSIDRQFNPGQIAELIILGQETVSLNAPAGDAEDSKELVDFFVSPEPMPEDERTPQISPEVARQIGSILVRMEKAGRGLKPPLKVVFGLYYGLPLRALYRRTDFNRLNGTPLKMSRADKPQITRAVYEQLLAEGEVIDDKHTLAEKIGIQSGSIQDQLDRSLAEIRKFIREVGIDLPI